jgi:hypothetical protein
MTMRTTTALVMLGLVLAGRSLNAQEKWDMNQIDVSKLPLAAAKSGVTYAKDIRPLLEASCFRCHGEQRPKGGLRLDSLEAVLKGGDDGKVVIAGDSKKSLLVAATAQVNDEIAMPPKRGPGGPGRPGGPSGRPSAGNPPGSGTNAPGAGRPGVPGGIGGGWPGGPSGPQGGFGPPAKPLTAAQVGLIRAWIDQGAK